MNHKLTEYLMELKNSENPLEIIENILLSVLDIYEDFENNQININNVINELRENGIDIPESNLFESIEELHITPEELLELDSVDTSTDEYKEIEKKVLDEINKSFGGK